MRGEDREVLAARVAARIAPDTQMGVAFRQGAQGLVAQLQGQSRPAFLIASGAQDDTGFALGDTMSFALRRDLGDLGLTLSAESGTVLAGARGRFATDFARSRAEGNAIRFGASLDGDYGPLTATLLMKGFCEHVGAAPRSFSFRGRAPLFSGGDVTLRGRRDEDQSHALWAEGPGGYTAMTATISTT